MTGLGITCGNEIIIDIGRFRRFIAESYQTDHRHADEQ